MSYKNLETIRCVKCGKSKPSKEFIDHQNICQECISFQSKKFVKSFCFRCHRPIYESTPHVIAMVDNFTEFICQNCFNSGKYKPRGELNYFNRCRGCGNYFYTTENRQQVCSSVCGKKPSVTHSQDSSNRPSTFTHGRSEVGKTIPPLTDFSTQTQFENQTSTLANSGSAQSLMEDSA